MIAVVEVNMTETNPESYPKETLTWNEPLRTLEILKVSAVETLLSVIMNLLDDMIDTTKSRCGAVYLLASFALLAVSIAIALGALFGLHAWLINVCIAFDYAFAFACIVLCRKRPSCRCVLPLLYLAALLLLGQLQHPYPTATPAGLINPRLVPYCLLSIPENIILIVMAYDPRSDTGALLEVVRTSIASIAIANILHVAAIPFCCLFGVSLYTEYGGRLINVINSAVEALVVFVIPPFVCIRLIKLINLGKMTADRLLPFGALISVLCGFMLSLISVALVIYSYGGFETSGSDEFIQKCMVVGWPALACVLAGGLVSFAASFEDIPMPESKLPSIVPSESACDLTTEGSNTTFTAVEGSSSQKFEEYTEGDVMGAEVATRVGDDCVSSDVRSY